MTIDDRQLIARGIFSDVLQQRDKTIKEFTEALTDNFNTVAMDIVKESMNLLESKGKSYAGGEDSLANFKRNAERLSLSPYQIWAVYFNKHVDSINNAIADNPNCPVDKSESIYGRILDGITYLTILQCLKVEQGV